MVALARELQGRMEISWVVRACWDVMAWRLRVGRDVRLGFGFSVEVVPCQRGFLG